MVFRGEWGLGHVHGDCLRWGLALLGLSILRKGCLPVSGCGWVCTLVFACACVYAFVKSQLCLCRDPRGQTTGKGCRLGSVAKLSIWYAGALVNIFLGWVTIDLADMAETVPKPKCKKSLKEEIYVP